MRVLLVLALLFAAASAAAAEARVAAVVDGDTLALEDGRRLRLAGIEAPKPPPGLEADRPWPLAAAAATALGELAAGRTLRLPDHPPEDRHGRLLAQAERDDGLWLQGEMLRRGLARVMTRPDARDRAAAMLAVEAAARQAGRGLWGTAAFAVRPAEPEALRRDRHTVQVVEGRVVRAAKMRGQVYLNFGADWRSDVTARIDGPALRLFAEAGMDPLALQGAAVRVRGWIGDWNGPMIALTHPEQVERLDGANAAAPPPSAGGAAVPGPAVPGPGDPAAGEDFEEGGDE
ncbi:thermonuclease family protein [Azospirillum sp. ST 5-10]|uniref:thermonuclease family protein n=1 Tax=unclassified Azospirillum TaxID=2630922 RepID=UPI003F4A77A9